MNSKFLKSIVVVTVILAIGFSFTAASWLVITGRNVQLDPGYIFTQLDGTEVVGFGCDGSTLQPVTRGLPLRYSFYSSCRPEGIVEQVPFAANWAFWSSVSAISYLAYRQYRKKSTD